MAVAGTIQNFHDCTPKMFPADCVSVTLVTVVEQCALGAPEACAVRNASMIMLGAHTVIERGNITNTYMITAKADRIENLEKDKALLVDALKDLGHKPELKPSQRAYIFNLLQKVSEDATVESPLETLPSHSTSGSWPISGGHDGNIRSLFGGAEHNASSEIGSPGLDAEVNQDIHLGGGSGMVGFIGKMSETSWMRRIVKYLVDSSSKVDVTQHVLDYESPVPDMPATLTYFMDEEDLLSINEDKVHQYERPPPETSLLLAEAFFHSIQGAFPFVSYQSFHSSLAAVTSEGFPSSWADIRQLALFNIVWASGARWLQKSELGHGTFAENHLVYYARARALGCDHRIQFEHPDVQMLQSIGIMAYYLLLNGSLQRAWNVIGQTIRHAISHGLHLSFTPDAVNKEDFETKRNLWHALYRLETLLAEILGRPTCIQHYILMDYPPHKPIQAIDTPPNDIQNIRLVESRSIWTQFLEQNQWKSSSFSASNALWNSFPTTCLGIPPSYFPAVLSLSRVSSNIAVDLFSNPPQRTWYQVQCSIQDIEAALQTWCTDLPQELRIENIDETAFDPRLNLELAMNLCSTQILLYRPCLCKIEIEHESAESHTFNVLRARFCVRAAVKMMNLLPANPVAAQILQILPCWSMLHYISQAGTVLLLEMCLSMQHLPTEAEQVTATLKKVLEYLWILSPHMKSAYRAYLIFRVLAENVSQRFRGRLLLPDIAEPAIPSGWNDTDNAETVSMLKALRQLEPE